MVLLGPSKAQLDKPLDITALAIGAKDAYYHFPFVLKRTDIACLACNFALEAHRIACEDQGQQVQWDFKNIVDNYVAGYHFGRQGCNAMSSEEHRKILANCHRLEAEEGDMGLLLVFGQFKEDIEDLVMLRGIKDINDFVAKTMEGELVWQSHVRS